MQIASISRKQKLEPNAFEKLTQSFLMKSPKCEYLKNDFNQKSSALPSTDDNSSPPKMTEFSPTLWSLKKRGRSTKVISD